MITKAFEIRDRLTIIPVIATVMASDKNEEAYLLGRAGYLNHERPSFVVVTRLVDTESANDPHDWSSGARTMQIAHQYIMEHFHELETGAVIDVEYILGETLAPKISERLEVLT